MTANREPMQPRRMADPWFQANTYSSPICEMLDRGRARTPHAGERALGAYVYNQVSQPDHPCDGWLLDGQQRVTAILGYMADEFAVKGYRYSEITEAERRGFEMKPIACLQTSLTREADCLTIYERLAYGGTAHEPQTTGA